MLFHAPGAIVRADGAKEQFLLLTTFEGGSVTFDDNSKGIIKGVGKVGKSLSQAIENVYL